MAGAAKAAVINNETMMAAAFISATPMLAQGRRPIAPWRSTGRDQLTPTETKKSPTPCWRPGFGGPVWELRRPLARLPMGSAGDIRASVRYRTQTKSGHCEIRIESPWAATRLLQRKSRSRAISAICSADSTAVTSCVCGAVCIS